MDGLPNFTVTALLVDAGKLDPRDALLQMNNLATAVGYRAAEGAVDLSSDLYTLRLNVLTGKALFGPRWHTKERDEALALFHWLLRGWTYPDIDPARRVVRPREVVVA